MTDRRLPSAHALSSASRLELLHLLAELGPSPVEDLARTTGLHHNTVREHLEDFLVVRFQAERLEDEAIRPVLEEFGVLGLPTYVVLHPAPAVSSPTDSPASVR